jgi:hypothetical protein
MGMPLSPPPVPAPATASTSLIAIKVTGVGGLAPSTVERVYFVRIEDGDPLSQRVLIPSNYFEDGYVYLMNARPGRYAAVAASNLFRGGGEGVTTGPMPGGGGGGVGVGFSPGPRPEEIIVLPAKSIEGTLVELESASVAFMGEWVMNHAQAVKDDADAAQLHYARVIEVQKIGGYAGCSGHPGSWTKVRGGCGDAVFYTGYEKNSDRSGLAWHRFLAAAQERLAGTGWEGILADAVGVASGPAESAEPE